MAYTFNYYIVFFILFILQISPVQNAKSRILREISLDTHDEPRTRAHYSHPHSSPFDRSDETDLDGPRADRRRSDHSGHDRWSAGHHHRRKNRFGEWSPWSRCRSRCMQMRERSCSVPRRCGSDQQIETRQCTNQR